MNYNQRQRFNSPPTAYQAQHQFQSSPPMAYQPQHQFQSSPNMQQNNRFEPRGISFTTSPVYNNNSNLHSSHNRPPFRPVYRARSQSFNSSCSPKQWSIRSNQSHSSNSSSSSYFGDVSQSSPYSSPRGSRGGQYYSRNKNKRFQRNQNFQSPESDSNPGHSYNIEDYVNDSMLEDPWKELMAEIEKKENEKNNKTCASPE